MFNFFKKKKKPSINEEEIVLLHSIVEKLPDKFSYLKLQLDLKEEFILEVNPNCLLGNRWKTLGIDQNIYYKKRDRKGDNLRISGITVFDVKQNKTIEVEVRVFENIITGYRIDSDNNDFALATIDLANLSIFHYENEDLNELTKIIENVDNEISNILDIEDTFKIEIENSIFYVIKNLGDGDYLAVTSEGKVFMMIHDPYELENIFLNVKDFFDALKSKKFNINDYYEDKFR